MSYSTCLTCKSTTVNIYKHIELVNCLCCYKWLTNYNLECLKTEVAVNISLINCDLTCTRC